MMSPGINSGRGENNHNTGTVPKVKCHNHNDAAHQHSSAGGVAHSSPLCGVSGGHAVMPTAFMRRDFGFSHMNNNLTSTMDWQPTSDATQQSSQHQQGNFPTRIRKESNTSASLATYDIPDIGSSGSNSGGLGGGGVTGVAPVIDGASPGPGLFYDIPLHNSNHGSVEIDDVNQLRWDQEGGGSSVGSGGGGSGGGNAKRHQQKSSNISEQSQVASRLHQIRDYIGQTTSVMERLQAAGSPQHIEQWLRLHDILEGLRDSERKLSNILDVFSRVQAIEENLDKDEDEDTSPVEDEDENLENEADSVPKSSDAMTRRNELKVKVEESQRKLFELREQQAALLALKQKAQEQLREARAAQGALLAAQEQRDDNAALQDCNQLEERLQSLHQFYELAQLVGGSISGGDSTAGEVIQLQNKLEELQTKKMQIDQMVSRFDGSNSAPSFQAATTNNNGTESLGVTTSSSNSSNYNLTNSSNSDVSLQLVQTTEDKVAELSRLKEQLARMQNAMLTMSSKSAPAQTSSNPSSSFNSNGAAVVHYSQESDGLVEHDNEIENEELVNVLPSSASGPFNFKQDNRTQAISQNHHHRQPNHHQPQQQQQMHLAVAGGGNSDRSITPTAIVQQQLHAKSLKLQEAKARLHHLQELLSLVEEFREAGKPVPENILMLLNSPNGPLSNEDNLDLERERERDQQQLPNLHQTQSSSSSSSSSSLMSLFQPQVVNNNGNSISISNSQMSSASIATKERDKDTVVLQASNSSSKPDISSIQNLYQPPPSTSSMATQSHIQRQHQGHSTSAQPPIIAKQKNNAPIKLCSKTQQLEEWMKKDEDPVSCINTDLNSQLLLQQQQALGGYSIGSGFPVYQDVSTSTLTTCPIWERSPDYSSDEGGRSEDETENDEYLSGARKAPQSLITQNGSGSGIMTNTGGSCGVSSVSIGPASSNISSGGGQVVNSKDHTQSSTVPCPTATATNYMNLSREISLDGGSVTNLSSAGASGSQSCNPSVINQMPCNMWRKHSTGSTSSLPVYSVSSRGTVAPPQSVWAPNCYCCYNRQDGSNGTGEGNMCAPVTGGIGHSQDLPAHHPNDNNMNWVVHQISQLQAQLQQMMTCQTVASNKQQQQQQQGLLMTSSSSSPSNPNLWMASSSSPFSQQQPLPSFLPPALHTSPTIGAVSSDINNYTHTFGGQMHKQHYQHLLVNSLNQCCQLIWHQQCELAQLKETLHNVNFQQQHQFNRNPSHVDDHQLHQAQPPQSHCATDGTGVVGVADEQYNSCSNLGRFSQPQPHHRNRLTTDAPPSSSRSSPHPPLISLPPPHYFYPSYGNNLNLAFQPFRHSSPVASYMSSPAGTLNNQVPPGNRANNYWDNFRSYSRQNLLSARSKCNEGRSNSSSRTSTSVVAAGDMNGLPNERCRTSNSGGRHAVREMHREMPWGGNVTASVSAPAVVSSALCGGSAAASAGAGDSNAGGPSLATSFQQQHVQINALNTNVNMSLDEMMTHNLPNHKEKEKLNTYQSHPQLFPQPPLNSPCVNNNRLLPISSASSRSPSQSFPVADPNQQQVPQRCQKQQLTAAESTTRKGGVRDFWDSFRYDVSKGACKKSCKLKEQPHRSDSRNSAGVCDQFSNISSSSNNTNSNSCSVPNNNSNSNSNTVGTTNTSGVGDHGDFNMVEVNTINNRQVQQQPSATAQWGVNATNAADDLPRNSNCKRRLLMSSTTSFGGACATNNQVNTNTNTNSTNNKCNSNSSSVRTESNDLLLDSLEESMYSEVAALISVNEQRPSYLLQLFKDLKQLNSDHDRQAALLTIHNLAARSAASITNCAQSQCHNEEIPQGGNVMAFKAGDNIVTNDTNKNVPPPQHPNTVSTNGRNVTASDDGRHRTTRRQQQQQQPRNIPWRCTKDSAALASSTSVLPMNCRKLDWEVRSILVDMLPFLKSHLSETCTLSLLESVRSLVLQLVPSPQNVPGQLDALLEDALFKFQGCRMHDICDELISVVADVLISELTFLRLTTSVNTSAPGRGGENGFCAAEDEDEEDEVLLVEQEEGAVGGVNDRVHDSCQSKTHLNNRHQYQQLSSSVVEISGSSKSDPVVSDAELAEADQSGRHSNTITSATGLPVMTNSGTITESEQLGARINGCNKGAIHGNAQSVDAGIVLSPSISSSVVADNNASVLAMYENSNSCINNGAAGVESQQHQNRKVNASNPHPTAPAPSSLPVGGNAQRNVVDLWAVENDRDQQTHVNRGAPPQVCLNLNNSSSGTGNSECGEPLYNNDGRPNSSLVNGFPPNNPSNNGPNNSDGNTTVAAV